MFEITLKNDKKFLCDKDTTIFQAAKSSGIFLDHSCLTARCRSCIVKIEKGTTVNQYDELVLSEDERQQNLVLLNKKLKSYLIHFKIMEIKILLLFIQTMI